jgi:hypothetical protein
LRDQPARLRIVHPGAEEGRSLFVPLGQPFAREHQMNLKLIGIGLVFALAIHQRRGHLLLHPTALCEIPAMGPRQSLQLI